MVSGTYLEKKGEAMLNDQGWLVHRTKNSKPIERGGHWISTSDNDILGAFDLLAIHPEHMTRLIQSTVYSHMSERKKKVDDRIPFSPCNTYLEVWAWEKKGRRWTHREFRRREPGDWKELGLEG